MQLIATSPEQEPARAIGNMFSWSSLMWVSSYASRQTDRQTDRLITI